MGQGDFRGAPTTRGSDEPAHGVPGGRGTRGFRARGRLPPSPPAGRAQGPPGSSAASAVGISVGRSGFIRACLFPDWMGNGQSRPGSDLQTRPRPGWAGLETRPGLGSFWVRLKLNWVQ